MMSMAHPACGPEHAVKTFIQLIGLYTLTNGCILLDVKLVFSKVQDKILHCILNRNPLHRDFSKKPRFNVHLFPPKKASMASQLIHKNSYQLFQAFQDLALGGLSNLIGAKLTFLSLSLGEVALPPPHRPGSHPPESHTQLHFLEWNIPDSPRGAARPPFRLALPSAPAPLRHYSLLVSHHRSVWARPMAGPL